MTQDLVRAGTHIVPALGLVIDLENMAEVSDALDAVRDAKRQLEDARRALESVLLDRAQELGTKTLTIAGKKRRITGGTETVYDVTVLQELLDLGLPQERYAELVKEEISYKVSALVAKAIESSGNATYADVIRRSRMTHDKPWRVS